MAATFTPGEVTGTIALKDAPSWAQVAIDIAGDGGTILQALLEKAVRKRLNV